MRIRRVIVAVLGILFCVLLASTTTSARTPSPSAEVPRVVISTMAMQAGQLQQNNDDEDYIIALDTDGDRRFDDANRDGKPDHWFKVAKKFIINCGPLAGCLFTTAGWGLMFCATPALFQCLDAYEDK